MSRHDYIKGELLVPLTADHRAVTDILKRKPQQFCLHEPAGWEQSIETFTLGCAMREFFEFAGHMKEIGTAFSFQWDYQYQLDKGHYSLRFTEKGEAITKLVRGHNQGVPLDGLVAISEAGMRTPQKLAKLQAYIETHRELVTVLPWDYQDEYGQRYLARQLILPQEELRHG